MAIQVLEAGLGLLRVLPKAGDSVAGSCSTLMVDLDLEG